MKPVFLCLAMRSLMRLMVHLIVFCLLGPHIKAMVLFSVLKNKRILRIDDCLTGLVMIMSSSGIMLSRC